MFQQDNQSVGSTKVHNRQTFTLGQTDVPDNPTYYSRTDVTSSAGASNYVLKTHNIEGVETFAGETCILSFYAKADSSKNIATSFLQYFGSGGSPSADVNAIGPATHALTTSWQKFTSTVTIPSVSGKTLGTSNNDSIKLLIYFDAGSDHDLLTNSLGQQSGIFDIAHVQLEKGSTATDFETRHIGQELALCQRYYHNPPTWTHQSTFATTNRVDWYHRHPVIMRATPSITGTPSVHTGAPTSVAIDADAVNAHPNYIAAGASAFNQVLFSHTFDAEL
jgi:hypothetical protein